MYYYNKTFDLTQYGYIYQLLDQYPIHHII